MKFKDKVIHNIIEKLYNQYHIFTDNQFINYYMLEAKIPKNDLMDIEDLINSNKYYEAEGYDLNKLYEQILSFTFFLSEIKNEILPKIINESVVRRNKMSPDNKILYKMTLDNIPANLNMFYNLIIELFNNIKKIDEKINEKDDILYKG